MKHRIMAMGLVLCFAGAGCSGNTADPSIGVEKQVHVFSEEDTEEKGDRGREKVEQIVEKLFEDLGETEYQEMREPGGEKISDQLETAGLPGWVEDRFQDPMTEKGYESFTGTGMYQIPVRAYEEGQKMELEELKVEKEKDSYEISAKLALESAKGQKTLDIAGTAQTDQEGKVSYLDFSNISEIMESLEE